MKPALRILLTLSLAGLPLFAQTNFPQAQQEKALQKQDLSEQMLRQAELSQAQGQIDKAIALARFLADSGQASKANLARAYLLLGTAYNQKGRMIEAQKTLEQALRLLAHDPDHASDYASALSSYAAFYCELGRLDAAEAMWLKSLDLREQIGDHAATMRSLVTLAGLELGRNHRGPARKYLKRAVAEVKSDHQSRQNNLTEDDSALLLETEGWLAMKEGHLATAVTAYKQSLDISRRMRGDEHWLTGWEHVLLGKAYAQARDLTRASFEMSEGLRIMEPALGRSSPNFTAGELAYAQLLDRTGSHAHAAEIRAEAEEARKDLLRTQCAGCTINVEGFR